MRCIIVEDEQLARQLVESYLLKINGLELKGTFKNPFDAIEFIQKNKIDLIFSDIQMPGMKGTDFIESLPYPIQVIFTTAYPDYAVKGFELNAVDYLLKPFTFERFVKAVNKVKLPENEIFETENTIKKDYIVVKADHKLYKINFSEINYIEGMREYVSFVMDKGRVVALMSLKKLEETLDKNLFIRVHKSFIVNKTKVDTAQGNQLEIKGKTIPVGNSYKDSVLNEIF